MAGRTMNVSSRIPTPTTIPSWTSVISGTKPSTQNTAARTQPALMMTGHGCANSSVERCDDGSVVVLVPVGKYLVHVRLCPVFDAVHQVVERVTVAPDPGASSVFDGAVFPGFRR